MDINNLINKFLGQVSNSNGQNTSVASGSNLGLAGGAIAGGALALLMGNKNVRKLASTAASVGGMALLGGMAGKAFQNWQQQKQAQAGVVSQAIDFKNQASQKDQLEIVILKAMIAAAKSDGHIDSEEQQKIFKQTNDYNLTSEEKSLIFDLISRPISLEEVCGNLNSMEQKAEVYLASKIACVGDTQSEKVYLASLAEKLGLPGDLVSQLDNQVDQSLV